MAKHKDKDPAPPPPPPGAPGPPDQPDHLPAPPRPLLLGPPVRVPPSYGGEWEGAGAAYNLDRLYDWDLDRPTVMAAGLARSAALATERAALDPADAAAVAAFNARQQAANAEYTAVVCAWLIDHLVDAPLTPAASDVAAWRAVSPAIRQWLAGLGAQRAALALLATMPPPPPPGVSELGEDPDVHAD